MTILLLCEDTGGTTGWGTYTRDLAEGLRKKGHDVRVLTHEGFFSILPRPLLLMVYPWLARLAAYRLNRMLRKTLPDAIHITVEPYAMLVPYLPDVWQKRTVLTIHGTYGVQPVHQEKLRARAASYYATIARFITVSAYTKRRVEEELAMHVSPAASALFTSRTTVIHNGITLPALPTHADNAVKKILLVGGVKQRKGVLQALRGCAAYRDSHTMPFHFTVVGSVQDTAYADRIRREITALRLDDHVTLAGKVDDAHLEELYRAADAYLMPSETADDSFEGFGLVFLEANARGVPVIGPDDSGSAEAIAEGVSGYRVDIEDPHMIADRLHRILDERAIDPASCRKWAEEHVVDALIPSVEKVYAAITA